jgi:hypothetical protein
MTTTYNKIEQKQLCQPLTELLIHGISYFNNA